MRNQLKFEIPVAPRGQMRARSGVVTDKSGRVHSRTYKSAKQQRNEDVLREFVVLNRPRVVIQGPVLLGVRVVLPVPASKPKKWKAAALAGEIRPTGKPDLSNLIKNVEDVCNEIVWKDDAQIVEYLPGSGKWYGDAGRWEITIEYEQD